MKKIGLTKLLLLLLCSAASAQSVSDCLDCHEDNSLTMGKNGKEISLFIDLETYTGSPHDRLSCVECHTGFDPDEDPHKEVITPVDCAACHAEAHGAFWKSKHAGEISCTSCHENVHSTQQEWVILLECQSCHPGAAGDLKQSVHSKNGAGPNCVSCHSFHEVQVAGSDNCLVCHGEKEFVHENIVHEDLEFVVAYRESIHGELIECSDCHSGHLILPASAEHSAVARGNIVNTCANCHDEIAEAYSNSEHGKAFQPELPDAPTCTDCHGEHDIHQITDSRSKVSRQHEIEACQKCHLDSPDVRERMTHSSAFISSYANSIHGRAIEAGNLDAAVCSDCHGGHEEMKGTNPNSRVNKFNITATCGNCHEEITAEFKQSIHGTALADGIGDAPTCTDCHGEHNIIEHERAESPVAPQNVSQQVCGPCHSSVKLSEKYGFPSDKYAAYVDSYHGLAVNFGSVEAANCASCHGIHDILPISDSRSRVNPANLAETCGACHPGANENFAKGKVHVISAPGGDELIYWISSIYIFLIVATIGSMTIYNAVDWIRKITAKYRERYVAPPIFHSEGKPKLYLRMTRSERIQHLLLLTSFMTLVITGFFLKFPDAWWVTWIRRVSGEALFDLRGLLHRIAAVVMIADSLYHIYYLVFTKRGKEFTRDMMIRFQDLKDVILVLKHNFGISKSKPRFGRFSYVEKAEYWALIWGTVIMTATGIAMWFENQFMGWFSKLFLDVCETIHYYEAWL
ncbi:MAG: cytochrome b/b6 domain-containing protein, partial [bacterium]